MSSLNDFNIQYEQKKFCFFTSKHFYQGSRLQAHSRIKTTKNRFFQRWKDIFNQVDSLRHQTPPLLFYSEKTEALQYKKIQTHTGECISYL